MIKIIGGHYKKTKLEVPNNGVRPTSAIKREAIFSILESHGIKNSYEIYTNRTVVDIFAGSGALGLEAISRGAAFAYFFEIDPVVLSILKRNCKKICKNNNFYIYEKNLTGSICTNFIYPVSVIFIDPPYTLNPFRKLLKILLNKDVITDQTIIVIETNKNTEIQLLSSIKIIKECSYGKTKISFCQKIN